ncbi:hypothetical protein JTB14_007683 [Gonioctena quinquepunctata]|nr:hypothetical protein JTB14_007683 [Gonioctena quinquepunctata]
MEETVIPTNANRKLLNAKNINHAINDPSTQRKLRSPEKRLIIAYTQEHLERVLELISSGQKSLNAVSKVFGIPKGTLHNKIHSLVPIDRKMGPSTVLKNQEEDRLEKWIIDKAKLGFPMYQCTRTM